MEALLAAHRKPRQQRLLGGTTARTAATIALAGASTATAFDGAAHAEPNLTPSQVEAKVDRLYQETEEATEKYNGAKEAVGEAGESLDELRDEAARRTDRLNEHRRALGAIAAAQYRHGTVAPAVQLALSSDPDQYLDRAALANRAGNLQASTVTEARKELRELDQLRADTDNRLTQLKNRQAELKRHKATVTGKLNTAKELLARLTAEQRAQYTATEGTGTGTAAQTRANRSSSSDRNTLSQNVSQGATTAPNSRAAQAVAFAHGALGSPYVWGATGPNAFDCSGLTQAAWRSAGVSLPRTTYTQINAGRRIARSQLAPGDLVFFYSGISHVGLYIGNGLMIHAPRPGSPVRIAPITEMPFAGATRPL